MRPETDSAATGETRPNMAKASRDLMIHQKNVVAAPSVGESLFIGQDRLGQWVVRDARCMCGGLFANRTEAIRFAMYECQRRPQSVIMLPNGLELEDFCAAIRTGSAPRSSRELGLEVVRMIEAVDESLAQSGARVQVSTMALERA